MTLREKIQQEIHERGPIPFSRYMEMCLYHPELGYYSRDGERFGKAGDFYTSSDVHAIFGRLLARQFEEMWQVLGSPDQIEILELGPGRGLFAGDVLDWSEKKFPKFFHALHCSLVERSVALQERLRSTLNRHFESAKASMPQGLKAPECPAGIRQGTTSVVPLGADVERALAAEIPIIIFANEFFDALPVEILGVEGELRIDFRHGRLVETWNRASIEELEFLDRYGVHPAPGERIEVPLIAQQYIHELASAMQRGFTIVVDYGYTREEQVAGRHRGTLMAFRRHSATADPYQAPGEQDISAHVNFTALAAAEQQNGMQVQPLLTQSQFLMGIGERSQFADAFEECRLPQERAKVALPLKHLITPAGVGETFHVLVASKGMDQDRAATLSGLNFSKKNRNCTGIHVRELP